MMDICGYYIKFDEVRFHDVRWHFIKGHFVTTQKFLTVVCYEQKFYEITMNQAFFYNIIKTHVTV